MNDPSNGFISTVWGPALWFALHCISLNFPVKPTPEDKRNYRVFFESLGNVLPCGVCRSNFKQNLDDIGYDVNIHYESRVMFSYLVYSLHDQVRQNQKKSNDMTYVDCYTFYEQFRAQSCVPNTILQEGGCLSKKKVQCTLRIEPSTGSPGRYTIDPSCVLK
jgi:hypothetical protein